MKKKLVGKDFLEKVGLDQYCPEDFMLQEIVLRDGRCASLWVHKKNGHGILDCKFWENPSYYKKRYRDEHSATLGSQTENRKNLDIYRKTNQKQFDTFSKFLNKNTRYLEIGPSFGGVFNKVVNFGVKECRAIEPSVNDAKFIQKNNDIAKVNNVNFEEIDLEGNYYDLIVSIEVLEHTINPKNFLKKCYNLLTDSGNIHLEVPNHHNILLTAYNKNINYNTFYYHKAHVHYFTANSLQDLCKYCGLKGEVSSFLLYPFFNHVYWLQNRGPQASAEIALNTSQPYVCKQSECNHGQFLNDFYGRIEEEYERLICSKMLGDSLIFQGSKVHQ